jgi:hypothetical protein
MIITRIAARREDQPGIVAGESMHCSDRGGTAFDSSNPAGAPPRLLRHRSDKPAYLNAIEKANCMYCSNANGMIAQVRTMAGRTGH